MALREYVCSECGHRQDELFAEGYPSTVECDECGAPATYKIGMPVFRIDFRDGFDVGAGAYFNTARERDTYADKNGLRRIRD
jgi:predicted nucleic acid-binding Zn ribbon protein